jgi:hypothetical protein
MKPTASTRAVRWASIAAIACAFSGVLHAQTPPPAGGGAADDAAWRQQMEGRMQQLEQENASLRKEVGHIEDTKQAVEQDATSRGATGATGLQARPVDTTPADFDVHKYVAEGNFPGSITIPGTNVSIQIGGFVQLDAITDTNAIGSKDSFIVSSIPTAGDTAGQTNFSVRQTRLFVKTEAPTGMGSLVTYVEGDFFGPDGTDFRIRHAYGQIGDKSQFLAGQTWSTFMDASVYPAIFDYQGPNSMVLVRQPLIRYLQKFEHGVQWQISLEDPNADLSAAPPQAGHNTSVMPDVASNVRWTPSWGHLQLAGILRQMQFDPEVGSRSTAMGWGLNLTGQVNVLQPLAEGIQDNVVFQGTAGYGIENYINDTSGLGLDGFVDATGQLKALGVWGAYFAYQHYWAVKWASSIGYSYLHVDNNPDQAGGAYHAGHYVVVNVTYAPVERILCGLEALYGVRENKDANTGSDGRLSFSVQYRF